MANFNKPTIQETFDSIINTYITKTENKSPLLEKGVIKSFSWAIAGITSLLWDFANFLYLQVFPQTAKLPALKLWGYLVKIDYKEGNTNISKLRISNVAALQVEAGTVWKSLSNGLTYKAVSTAQTSNNEVYINVKASKAGIEGNLSIGELLNISNPIQGVPDTAEIIEVITEGSPPEDIEDFRQRVLLGFRRKPQGGSAIDYYLWATEVSGITEVFPYVITPGKVTLYVVSDGTRNNRTPTGAITPSTFPVWTDGIQEELSGTGQFLEVAQAISGTDNLNNRRPIQVPVELLPPVYKGFKVNITELTPVTSDLIEKIKSNLTKFLDSKKPHIQAIGYLEQNAKININQLSYIVQGLLDNESGTYGAFELKDSSDNDIASYTLGVGTIAYLEELQINGEIVSL